MAPKLTLPCTYQQAVQQQYAEKAKGASKDYMMGAMQEAVSQAPLVLLTTLLGEVARG